MLSSPPSPFAIAADIIDPPEWEPAGRAALEPHQVPPAGQWSLWLLEGGRGSGKTEACARYFASYMRTHPGHRGRIIAPTFGDAVESCVRGPSGLLSVDPEIRWVASDPGGSKVVWPNGSEALVLGTPKPDDVNRLRAGGNRHIDWWEEMAANAQLGPAWDQAQLGLRLGAHPHAIGSTTPRRKRDYRRVRALPGTVLTHATMYDNPHNPEEWVERMRSRYEGTTLGRQEIGGQLLPDDDAALWRESWFEDNRVYELPPNHFWQGAPVIGVDTADGKPEGDMQSYSVVGLSSDHRLYVVEHEAMRVGVDAFAGACIDAAVRHHGRIVLEANHGGAFAKRTFEIAMRERNAFVPLELVHASQGKRIRAEPVAALYEQGRVSHVGQFPDLEDQLTSFTGAPGEKSPDRLDSLVWAIWKFTSYSFKPYNEHDPGSAAIPYPETGDDDYALPYSDGDRPPRARTVAGGAVPWS